MILWHDLLVERLSYPVSSTHHQTLLSKAIFEHCLYYAQVASVVLASKSIQNSSLSPNFAANVVVDETNAKFFNIVFHPSSSLPIQFVPELAVHSVGANASFLESLKSTKYFQKSLASLFLSGVSVSGFLGMQKSLYSSSSDANDDCLSTTPCCWTNLRALSVETDVLTKSDIDFIARSSALPTLRTVRFEPKNIVDDQIGAVIANDSHFLVEVKCNFSDSFGKRVSTEPFHEELPVTSTMHAVGEMIISHFGLPLDACYVIVDVQNCVIENYCIVAPTVALTKGVKAGVVAGNEDRAHTRPGDETLISFFFRSTLGREFEIRPFPQDSHDNGEQEKKKSQVYPVCFGEIGDGFESGKISCALCKTPIFISLPLTATIDDAKNFVLLNLDIKPGELRTGKTQNRELFLLGQFPQYFPDWDTLIQNYFRHTTSSMSRPKALLVNINFASTETKLTRDVPAQNQTVLKIKR